MWKQLFKFNKTDRAWHLPVVAGFCVAIPLLLGLLYNDIEAGKLASIGALVILYIQSNRLVNRMMILMVCSFGFIFSFAIGVVFSFNPWLTPVILALYTFGVHYSLNRLELTIPPGNFFFVMIASIAISLRHNPTNIASSIGNFSIGVMIAFMIAFFYSILVLREGTNKPDVIVLQKNTYVNMTESIIFGIMVGLALLIAILLKLENPYWVPISCMAVMQGVTAKHIWIRAAQRVLGTFIGLGLTWFILQMQITTLGICISILLLQTIVEFLVVRNYGIAVIFISMLTIFLAEPNMNLIGQPDHLIAIRFFDILIGSIIGAAGGWMLYHEQIHFFTKKQLLKTKVIMKKYGH
ncbi:FUSC family protein [Pedobacter sp. PLR]|uniref:FUSC family protein n=1 Tax=Pedobacter sp. PLR TaxID=2994465 RepID=UPI0022455E3C|nr:FUSC family protein [Pedobacter sp. PLR]MCX2452292.1 FUSC family protein [Pedobacter sp. PLR]